MQENKELELLRKFFDEACFYKIDEELKGRILEIQKKNKLKRKIESFRMLLIDRPHREKQFNEILKELGYEC